MWNSWLLGESILVRSYFNHMSGSDRADVYFAPEPAQRVP